MKNLRGATPLAHPSLTTFRSVLYPILFRRWPPPFKKAGKVHVPRSTLDPGAYEGGRASPLYACPLWERGLMGGYVLLILHLPQAIYILLHCIALTQTKRLRKELKYILIYNNTLKSFVWSSVALKIHVFHFKLNIYICGFLQKWLAHFLLQKRWRNEGFLKVHRTCHSINGGSLEITPFYVFHLNIITLCKKISLLPLTNKVSFKKL